MLRVQGHPQIIGESFTPCLRKFGRGSSGRHEADKTSRSTRALLLWEVRTAQSAVAIAHVDACQQLPCLNNTTSMPKPVQDLEESNESTISGEHCPECNAKFKASEAHGSKLC